MLVMVDQREGPEESIAISGCKFTGTGSYEIEPRLFFPVSTFIGTQPRLGRFELFAASHGSAGEPQVVKASPPPRNFRVESLRHLLAALSIKVD